MINGGTLTPSVGVLVNHHLTYSNGLIYYSFETDTNLFVIAIFDTKTNSFTDEIYESIHEYKDSFIYGGRIYFLGNFGMDISISSSNEDFYSYHPDISNSNTKLSQSSNLIQTTEVMNLKSLGSYTFTTYYDNSTKDINYQKNPEPTFKIFLDPVFYETDSSFKVSKSFNTTVGY